MMIQRGVNKPYNQDTLDVWLLRDGLGLLYDNPASSVNDILEEIGWKGNKHNTQVVGFEDCIEFLLKRAEPYFSNGSYSFPNDLKDEVADLVDDMNVVLDELGYEVDFGSGNYVIRFENAA